MNKRWNASPRPKEGAGTALVLTLFFILLISALVVALLISMRIDRSSTQGYYQSARVQELATGALEEILSDLRSEIDAGSKPGSQYNVNGTQIYVPRSALASQPARIGFAQGTNGDYSTDVDPGNLKVPPTLVRVSRANPDTNSIFPLSSYDQTKLPPQRASPLSTTNYSVNSRTISPKRWNTSFLLSGSTTPPARFATNTPDWVYVARGGSRAFTDADVPNLKSSDNLDNTNSIVGRYAFIVYDTGGLIDINAAGFPSVLASTNSAVRGKSSIIYAALTSLPGLTNNSTAIDNFVKWRSGGSIGTMSATNFLNASTNWTQNGFLSATNGDNPILSRKDLIDYFTKKVGITNALPYLGTFSRSLVAPSMRPATPSGSAIDYSGNADSLATNPGVANRDLANVRFSGSASVTHYFDDGGSKTYSVKGGDSLLQSRFSLARLDWLKEGNPDTGNGPSGTKAQAIQDCFGLRWGPPGSSSTANGGNKCWTYVGASKGSAFNGTIKTLAEVAAEGREPDFFELLKASILSGSLAKYPGTAAFQNATRTVDMDAPYLSVEFKDEYYYPWFSEPSKIGMMGMYSHSFPIDKMTSKDGSLPANKVPAQVSDMQIMRIGANIIDQYDADSWPTAIYFGYKDVGPYDAATSTGNPIFGPTTMVYGIENLPYLQGLRQVVCYPDPAEQRIGGWRQPTLWNPHQKPDPNRPFARPQNYQIRAYGTGRTWWQRSVPIPDPTLADATYLNGMSQSVDYFTIPGLETSESRNRGTLQFTMSATTSAFYDKPYPLVQTGIDGVTATSPYPGNLGTVKMTNYDLPMVGYGIPNHFVAFSTGVTDPLDNPVSSKNQKPYRPIYPGGGKGLSAAARGGGNGGVTTYALGWVDGSGGFHPYSFITGAFAYGSFKINTLDQYGTATPYADDCDAWLVPDPRTERFSFGKSLNGNFESTMSVWQKDGQGDNCGWFPCGLPTAPGFSTRLPTSTTPGYPGSPYTFAWGDLLVNSPTDPPVTIPPTTGKGLFYWYGNSHDPGFYADADGIVRPGDGFYGSSTTGDGRMTFFSNPSTSGSPSATGDTGANSNISHGRRPVILNRPFNSVAELGYVFRDQPFKTLDFFTDKSADLALLDAFCLKDVAKVSADKVLPITAGKINPNSAPASVLKAILLGGSKKEADPGYNLQNNAAQSEVGKLSAALLGNVIQGNTFVPFDGYRGLVPALVQNMRTMVENSSPKFSSADKGNKAYLEAPLRALTESIDLRTWNLMIDLIAQTGQFSPNATKLSDFAVQGECRIWLHVSIDRYTGKVIARQLEPVYE